MNKILPLIFFSVFFIWQCIDRISEPTDLDKNGNEITNGELLKIVTPSQFGNKIETEEGVFTDALFIDYKVSDVWAIYKHQDGVREKLSIELSFDDSLIFFMFTDKYVDQNQVGHYAVYAGVPEDDLQPIENISLAVLISDDEELINKYFETIQPTQFGEIINTVEGDFIEAFFDSVLAEDVWVIQQTLPQGTKARINIARRIDRNLSYYLENDTRQDSLGTTLSGIKIGLPHEPLSPLRNIEIFISK